MYPEFIVIYLLLLVVIGMLGAVLFFLLKLVKNGVGNQGTNNTYNVSAAQQPNNAPYYAAQQYQNQYAEQYQQQGSVVFCNQCATQFDASQMYCPNCGARR